MAFTTGNDINILQATDSAIVGAGAGNDKYILSSSGLTAGQSISISDTLGTNTLQLIGGLTITSSKVGANVIQLTLSNGGIVNILGANNFSFELGGNPLTATSGVVKTFTQFATTSLGVTAVPTGSEVADGVANVGVNTDGTTTTTTAPDVVTFALTTGAADTFIGTANNDTVTGTTATLQAGDTIIDQSTTDNDVLNLTLTATNLQARVAGIENINVNWDAFGDAGFDATNVTGATVNLTSSKVGYLGNAIVTAAGANTIVAGSGMKGALTVNGVTAATVNAGVAATVTVAGSIALTDTVTVTAGAETTTVTVAATVETANVTAGAKTTAVTTNVVTATVDASAAAKDAVITVTGTAGTTDTATVKVGNDASVITTLTAAEKLTLDVAAGKVVTLATTAAAADTVEVKGAGAVTLKGTATNLTLDTITKSNTGALNVEFSDASVTATVDTAKIAADTFKLTAGVAAVVVAKTGQTFEVAAFAGTSTIEVGVKTDTAADALSLKLTSAAYAAVENTVATDAETLTITAAAAQASGVPTAIDLTIDDLIAGIDNQVIFNGTNDVELAMVTSAKVIDASALNGAFTVTATDAAITDLTVAGAQGKNDVTFDPTALLKGAFIGQSADDTVEFGAILAGATVTAVTGAGKDTVTVDATAIGGGAVSIETGVGDDTVNLTSIITTTGTIALQFGDGADTLKLAASSDVTAANLTITGLEKLVVETTALFTGAQLTGKTLIVEGTTALAVDTIDVTATSGTGETINLSGLTGTDSVTTGISGAILTGGAGKDVLIGTNRNDVIAGGADADQMTGGLGADTFVVQSGSVATAAVADVVTDFLPSAGDNLSFNGGINGTALVYTEGAAAVADYAAALAAAQLQLTGAFVYSAQQVGSDTYVFTGATGAATDVVKLTGVALTGIAFGDIVA